MAGATTMARALTATVTTATATAATAVATVVVATAATTGLLADRQPTGAATAPSLLVARLPRLATTTTVAATTKRLYAFGSVATFFY